MYFLYLLSRWNTITSSTVKLSSSNSSISTSLCDANFNFEILSKSDDFGVIDDKKVNKQLRYKLFINTLSFLKGKL